MREIILHIGTVNDNLNDFDTLFNLWRNVKEMELDVRIDFSHCLFLKQNAVAFLGGLARLIESRGGKVIFDWNTLKNKIKINLSQNGFMYAFDHNVETWLGNSIPYKEYQYEPPDDIAEYLGSHWLGRGCVNLSPSLQEAIIANVLEIYSNAFEHAQTNIGTFSCGQYYPKLNELKLTVIDFGVGIPYNVRLFGNNQTLPAKTTMQWAFQPGTSTRINGLRGGIGLGSLKNFIKANQGRLEIFSHEGYALIDHNQEIYSDRQNYFEGTLINITIKCDESYYTLADETDNKPFF